MSEQSNRSRTYSKISKIARHSLISRTILFGESIKDAAEELDIKYPTAKNIVQNFRNKLIEGEH
jgi:hypothetical protein